MADKVGARQDGSYKAVCTAPSINLTPMGPSMVPVPYPVLQDLGGSTGIVPTVNLNSCPVYVDSQSQQPMCTGDAAGTGGGVKSGTVSGVVDPTSASSTVNAGGKPVVRNGDDCTLNGGNCPGKYVTQPPTAGTPADSAGPDPTPETPKEEQGFWARQWEKVTEAVKHPIEAAKGVLKGIGNIPSNIGTMMEQGGAYQAAGEMDQAAGWQALLGNDEAANQLSQQASALRNEAPKMGVPDAFPMSNKAQEGGDLIFTLASLLEMGAGLLKGGVRTAGGVGKVARLESQGAKAVGEGGELLKGEAATAGAVEDVGKTVPKDLDPPKDIEPPKDVEPNKPPDEKPPDAAPEDGVQVPPKAASLREQYLGRTPGKGSRTGKEVIERMKAEGTVREGPAGLEFKASDGKWYDISQADMAHKTDAVSWWNEVGREYGAKSPEVRNWMLDSDNYYLEHYSINRSQGAILGQTQQYLPPLK